MGLTVSYNIPHIETIGNISYLSLFSNYIDSDPYRGLHKLRIDAYFSIMEGMAGNGTSLLSIGKASKNGQSYCFVLLYADRKTGESPRRGGDSLVLNSSTTQATMCTVGIPPLSILQRASVARIRPDSEVT